MTGGTLEVHLPTGGVRAEGVGVSARPDQLGVFPPKPSALKEIFGTDRVLIGVVHSLPLPGSPHYRGQSIDEVMTFAVEEARAYADGGVHGVIVENAWDVPFARPDDIGPETPATMGVMAAEVRREVGVSVGVNVLANGSVSSLAAAHAGGGAFVRVNQWVNGYVANEGFLNGESARATRYRSQLRAEHIRVFADVHVKHGSHAVIAGRSVPEQAEDNEFFDADVLIATGNRTGDATPLEEIGSIQAGSDLPVIVGSGLTTENAKETLEVCQGAIVGSALKHNQRWWGRVEVERVRQLAKVAQEVGYEIGK